MDVLMRPAINETRRIHAQAQGASNQVNQKRYTRGITDISGNSVAHASKVGVTQPPSASHVSPGSAHHADSSASAAFGSGRQHSGGSTTQVTFNNTAELLTSHIHIPQYSPIIASAESARRNGVRLQSQGAHFTNTFQQASLQQYQGRVSAGGFSDRHVRNTLNTQQVLLSLFTVID